MTTTTPRPPTTWTTHVTTRQFTIPRTVSVEERVAAIDLKTRAIIVALAQDGHMILSHDLCHCGSMPMNEFILTIVSEKTE
jgi:hypothetical protein